MGVSIFRPRLAFSADRSSAEQAAARAKAERFRRLMLPHMDAALTLARYLTRDASVAEDVVQEAYLRAFRGFDAWRGEAPKAWLLAIVRNCFLSGIAATRACEELTEEPVDRESPESLLADRNEAAMVRATVERLPEPFRETLVLRELEEMSYKEIAAITRVPIGTVMSRLARARQMFAELLLPAAEKRA
ncbi:sigma-70 family RNA polymerase sigma factor [Sphingomonas sp. KR3-1]|uniref:sigma-70 family RNA polymerase sigma factor n=1 Tax=Sphingomonas sp. KR3-1 TaxID=3156611 RepID=UPI0032B466FE